MVKLGGEWMRLEVLPCLSLVFLRGSIECGLEIGEGHSFVAGRGH